VSSRSYLSIGDVLTLLRQEFPDVTISKIRFLESQGLVNPERTPSGYRKFYEHDVERLRWVLRQQREHFLPLKVIKGRLEDDADGTETTRGTPPGPEPESQPAPSAPAESRAATVSDRPHADRAHAGGQADNGQRDNGQEPVLVGQRASSDVATRTADGATLPGIEPPPDPAPAAARPEPAMAGTTSSSASPGSAAAVAGASGPRPEPRAPAASTPKRARAASGGHNEPDPAPADPVPGSSPVAPPAPPAPAVSKGSAGKATATAGSATSSPAEGATTPVVDLNGTSLSIDELAAASGLDATVLVELQGYGLLHSMTVAGVEYFDEQALAVATLAAQFSRFGVEPRHLRLYKNAADREAGFVEQIVLPLVRQRNPEARARANEQVDELTRLGQQLRGALLRRMLGDLLNG
jgi:DNA-binding transcriptional MerR regulator